MRLKPPRQCKVDTEQESMATGNGRVSKLPRCTRTWARHASCANVCSRKARVQLALEHQAFARIFFDVSGPRRLRLRGPGPGPSWPAAWHRPTGGPRQPGPQRTAGQVLGLPAIRKAAAVRPSKEPLRVASAGRAAIWVRQCSSASCIILHRTSRS